MKTAKEIFQKYYDEWLHRPPSAPTLLEEWWVNSMEEYADHFRNPLATQEATALRNEGLEILLKLDLGEFDVMDRSDELRSIINRLREIACTKSVCIVQNADLVIVGGFDAMDKAKKYIEGPGERNPSLRIQHINIL